jgi:hypothetical protein
MPLHIKIMPLNINPILHTWFRDSCFTCDGCPTIQVFPLNFYIGMLFNHTKVIFQMGEGYAAIHRGGGLPVVGGDGQSDDS